MKPDWWARALSCFILSNVVESTVLSVLWGVLSVVCVAKHIFRDDD